MFLPKLQLRGVLNGDDAFGVRNEARQHVEQRRLAGTGAAADEHVQLCADAVGQELEHRRGERLERDEVFGLQALRRKTAD